MTTQEILDKVVGKAEKNGYPRVRFGNWQIAIFSHDFAKAFFGEGTIHYGGNPENAVFHNCAWKYHLGKMVLESDPLQYLAKFL